MSLKTLDVAIGVVFLYLLLTLVASVVVELLSTLRNWRGQMLYSAIQEMLSKNSILCAQSLYSGPFISTLARNAESRSFIDVYEWKGWRRKGQSVYPSYIPSSTFSTAIIYELIQRAPKTVLNEAESSSDASKRHVKPREISPDSTVELLNLYLQHGSGRDPLFAVIEAALAIQGPSVQGVRLAIERWFNECMDRVSGWYKRRTQACLLMLGLLVAFAANINTIAVSNWLWTGDAARQAIVMAAADVSKTNIPKTPSGDVDYSKLPQQIVTAETTAVALQYPLGWSHERSLHWLLENLNWVAYLFGCLITAIAISMGSTFWFDALGELMKIRGTGPKPAAR
jgi:hypothetical protein